MYLKSLVLQGFKSFANRIELTFQPGVAAVVGPNGSGKSNIADAMRWVLGEQSLRSLRGVRVQDIIFAGSDARRPLGMAEVSITLDNSNGELPLEFTEVTVTRRVFRSGESQFFINKTACRLRDIQELFLDSGIGRGSLSLIGQGEVDSVLSASPEDRRLLLEDAAGITRYRTRKEEALEKLEQTADDLLRVNDVITEVTSRLDPLARAAELAEQHAKLTHELETLEARLFGHEWARLDKQRRNETDKHATAAQEAEELSSKLESIEQQRTALEQQLQNALSTLESVRELLQTSREHEQQLIHADELAVERQVQTERELGRAQAALASATARSSTASDELAGAQQRMQAFDAAYETARAELALLTTENNTLDERIKVAVTSLEAARTELAKAERASALWEGELRSSEGESGHTGSRKERLNEQRAGLDAQRAKAAKAAEETNNSLLTLDHDLQGVRAASVQHEERQKELQNQLQALERSVAGHARRFNEVESRRRVLSEMASSYEGYFQGVRSVLSARNEFGNGVLGSVGELIRVPAELDVAIETALGSALQNIVTRTDKEAEAAIAYLKRTRGGRATFLPLASLRYQVFGPDERKVLSHPDVVGVAAELISYDADITQAALFLLGRTVITRTLQGALHISKQLRSFQRVVSLEGDLVSPGGAITGGATTGRSSGILARNRELEELQSQLEALAKEGAELEQNLHNAHKEVEDGKVKREALAKRLHEVEVNRAGVSRDRVARQAELERLAAMTASLDEEERLVGEHDRSLTERLDRARTALAEATTARTEWQQVVLQREQELSGLTHEQAAIQSNLTTARVEAAEANQRQAAAARDVTRLQAALADTHTLSQREEQAAAAAAAILEKVKSESELRKAAIGEARTAVAAVQLQVEQAKVEVDSVRENIVKTGTGEKELRQAREVTLEKLHRSEVALTRIQAAIAQVEEKLSALGGLPAETEEAFDLGGARKKADDLRQQIIDLGPVNPGAVQEYQEAQDRHNFLSNQREDLLAAKQRLEETIAEIDQTSTRRLRATYEKVSESFTTIFKRLFGGGQANLEWTDEEKMLDAGLELMVQPPGKKMQSLMALSGGERALTAIALLFAIMEVRPSPFCVLDEIDAALDEQNVSRFASLLTDFALQSQFIVITHRQATMEAADVLYGVTMDRSAASELVSLRLASLPGLLVEDGTTGAATGPRVTAGTIDAAPVGVANAGALAGAAEAAATGEE